MRLMQLMRCMQDNTTISDGTHRSQNHVVSSNAKDIREAQTFQSLYYLYLLCEEAIATMEAHHVSCDTIWWSSQKRTDVWESDGAGITRRLWCQRSIFDDPVAFWMA